MLAYMTGKEEQPVNGSIGDWVEEKAKIYKRWGLAEDVVKQSRRFIK